MTSNEFEFSLRTDFDEDLHLHALNVPNYPDQIFIVSYVNDETMDKKEKIKVCFGIIEIPFLEFTKLPQIVIQNLYLKHGHNYCWISEAAQNGLFISSSSIYRAHEDNRDGYSMYHFGNDLKTALLHKAPILDKEKSLKEFYEVIQVIKANYEIKPFL